MFHKIWHVIYEYGGSKAGFECILLGFCLLRLFDESIIGRVTIMDCKESKTHISRVCIQAYIGRTTIGGP